METNVTIEPMSITHISKSPQKRPSINFSTTIPLEIGWEEAWEIIEDIIRRCYPAEDVRLEAVTEDFGADRYCFSVSGKIEPEVLEVPIDV